MSDRRKRRRRSPQSMSDLHTEGANLRQIEVGESSKMGALQNGAKVNGPCGGQDLGLSVSKCSVRLINEVVSKFSQEKKDLVKAIGFEGILHFPHIKQFNRKFTMWLMSCVNERNATIHIGQGPCITFNKYDIGHVLGIPTGGKVVLERVARSRDAKEKVIQEFLGAEFKELRSKKIVQEIVERDYGIKMSKEDAGRFMVAFVVFVVSNLLAPSAKYDYASVDYWNAIEKPEEIGTYDWADFAFRKLLEGVTKLKQDLANNIKFPNITGCSIFIQVMYLDSLQLDGLSMPHTTLPRVREFTFERIRAMIGADQNFNRHMQGDPEIPFAKLRDVSDCIYSWAIQPSAPDVETRTSWLFSTWESAMALVHLLNIPLEAAGPLFVAVVNFQDQVNSGLSFNGTQATRLLNVIASLLMPYTRGFSYFPSYADRHVENGHSVVQSSISNGIGLLSFPIMSAAESSKINGNASSSGSSSEALKHGQQRSRVVSDISERSLTCYHVQSAFYPSDTRSVEAAHSSEVSQIVASIMAQFYSIFRKMKPTNDFDLNSDDLTTIGSTSATSIAVEEQGVVRNPWQMGFSWVMSEPNDDELIGRLSMLKDDDSLAVVHRKPKYIQVSMCSLASQLLGKSEMELDLFDALVRAVKQQDDELYSSYGTLRWRHFFESDFMCGILSGAYDLLDSSLRNQLCLSEVSYDLRKSNLVLFPALLQSQWVCFAWEPQKNVICVFDPGYCVNVPVRRVQLIERSCYMLKLALKTLTRTVFTGVARDVMAAEVNIMNIADPTVSRINLTGVLSCLFCRCFDGCDLVPSFLKVDVPAVTSRLLREIVRLKGNSGAISGIFEV